MAAFLIEVLCFISLIWSASAQSAGAMERKTESLTDNMGRLEKTKLILLSQDLLKDSVLKLRQIFDIRAEHSYFTAFSVGVIIGRIREKYRFMMEIYKENYDMHIERTIIRPTALLYFVPLYYTITLQLMRALELEIDKLVELLIDEAAYDMENNNKIAGQIKKKKKKKKGNATEEAGGEQKEGKKEGGRQGGWGGEQDGNIKRRRQRSREEIIKEEKHKSMLRQRFLMKKIGLPLNGTTTKKRFVRHWPVEDTWSLDKYNQFY